jgi:hypothetical protein
MPNGRWPFVLLSTRLSEVRGFSDLLTEFFSELPASGLPAGLRMLVLANKPSLEFKAFQVGLAAGWLAGLAGGGAGGVAGEGVGQMGGWLCGLKGTRAGRRLGIVHRAHAPARAPGPQHRPTPPPRHPPPPLCLLQELQEQRLTLVEGSVHSSGDLQRCRAEQACAALVLADRFTPDSAAEDTDVLFRVWALKSYTNTLPLFVQVRPGGLLAAAVIALCRLRWLWLVGGLRATLLRATRGSGGAPASGAPTPAARPAPHLPRPARPCRCCAPPAWRAWRRS